MPREMFALGFQTAQMTIAANLSAVTHEESLRQPVEQGNCLNWLAGHVLTSRDMLNSILEPGAAPSLSQAESRVYLQGSPPLTESSAAVPIGRLAEALHNTSAALAAKLQSMSAEDFGRPLDPKMFPAPVDRPTLANFLILMLFHEAYHAGQMGLGRRLLGKPSGIGI